MNTKKLKIKVRQAETFAGRFAGFMMKKKACYAIIFKKCSSVHTFFMRFNIDIIYLDKENRVLKIKQKVKPWRLAMPVKNTYSILEIPSEINNEEISLNDKINFGEI